MTAAARAGSDERCVVLEDFGGSAENTFPAGWVVREEAGRSVYSVRVENGVRFLHAAASGTGIQAAREHEWDLREYPVLRWTWRPRTFPRGADEQGGRNDSALAVYVVFRHTPVTVKSLKYIWSGRVAKGARLESSHGLTQVLVVESGAPRDPRAWVEERANVVEDYRRRFNERDAPKPLGIAVLTDSDDTKSYAEGDYAGFEACRG
jgi:hypothetical protein